MGKKNERNTFHGKGARDLNKKFKYEISTYDYSKEPVRPQSLMGAFVLFLLIAIVLLILLIVSFVMMTKGIDGNPWFILVYVFLFGSPLFFWISYKVYKKDKINTMKFDEMQKIYNLCKCNFVPSDEFLTMHIPELPGVYIHHNITKNIYYVGQAKNLNRRCKKHLTGYGNGDVYADKKYGDKFESAIVLLGDTDMSLNELERLYIKKYHASIDGYNRTEGNNG